MTADEIKALLEEADQIVEVYRGFVQAHPRRYPSSAHLMTQRLAAVVRELTAWRPMETAPRDGTIIEGLHAGSARHTYRVRWDTDDYGTHPGWYLDADQHVTHMIGHDGSWLGWRPIPPAPEVPR